jgi:hypothetical protein
MEKVKKSFYFVSEYDVLPATSGRYGFYAKGKFGANLSQKWLEEAGYTLQELTKEEAAAKYAAVKERQRKGEERLRKEREEYKQRQIQAALEKWPYVKAHKSEILEKAKRGEATDDDILVAEIVFVSGPKEAAEIAKKIGLDLPEEAFAENFDAWKNDYKSGHIYGDFHIFSPCGCNPLRFSVSLNVGLEWQKEYFA